MEMSLLRYNGNLDTNCV